MTDHFLFMSVPFWGHVFPSLAVAEELVRRGHRVTFVTGAEMGEAVRSVGARFVRYESPYEGADMFRMVTEADLEVITTVLYEDARAVLSSVEAHVGADVPDLVAYDIATGCNAGRVLAASWGRPALTFSPIFASGGKFSAMQSLLAAADSAEVGTVPDRFTAQLEFAGVGGLVPRLVGLLAERGISTPVDDFFSGTEEFNLVFLPRSFQYEGETFGERFSFVGPCLGSRNHLGTWTPPGDGHPVVLLSLGSVFNQQPFYFRTFIRAFTDAPVHAVVTLGRGVDPAQFGSLPSNVEVHRWAPHHAVLQHAGALVTHGGMGSVMESLHAGCPVLVMPLSQDVQPTGRRIVELGLGRVVQPEDVTEQTLRAHVLDLVSDGATAARARAMQRTMAEAGGTPRAADEIERYLRRTRG